MSELIKVPEYISDEDKNDAYFFINMLLKSLPIKEDEKNTIIDNINVKLTYNKTKLKREADFKIEYHNEYYSTKYLHSNLHRYNDLVTNWLVYFILSNKVQIEKFICN